MKSVFALASAQIVFFRGVLALRASLASPAGGVRLSRARRLSCACLLTYLALVAGCGGGSSSNSDSGTTTRRFGKLQVNVKWPPYQPSATAGNTGASRFIAPNTTRIAITVTDITMGRPTTSLEPPQTFNITRVNSSHTFALPAGNFRVEVDEFDDNAAANAATPVATNLETKLDTHGNPIRVATDTVTITDTNPQQLDIAPHTEVTQVVVNASSLRVGDTVEVTATPKNADGATVPIPKDALHFHLAASPTNPAATIDLNGKVTGVHYGSVAIQATVSLKDYSAPNATVTISSDPADVNATVNVGIKNVVINAPSEITLAAQSTVGSTQTTTYKDNGSFTASVPGDGPGIGNHPMGVHWMILDSTKTIPDPPGLAITFLSSELPTVTFKVTNNATTDSEVRGTYYLRAISRQDNTVVADAKVTVLGGRADVTVN